MGFHVGALREQLSVFVDLIQGVGALGKILYDTSVIRNVLL